MINPENKIWSEKYRPKLVKNVVGNFKDKILKHIQNPEAIPNFLLYSKAPGSGKTTLSKAIINELGCDYLIINSSDDRKIDTVREKVKNFALTQSSKLGKKRCVFLDEFDGMLSASQNALRNVMETYASNVFFLLTCNNINKVIEPIQSRCISIPFAYPDKSEIYTYLEKICVEEKMDYTEDGINKLINKNYPSIRNCVLALQDLWTQGKQVTPDTVVTTNAIFEELWVALKKKDWRTLKETVMATEVDPRELNSYFWNKCLDDDNLNIKMIQILCRNEKDIASGSDPKVIVVTSLIELVK